MNAKINRQQAWELLNQYNKDAFHLQHALTVEGVMRWFAKEQGFGEDEEFWGIVGLLHDIDFEQFPDRHCIKAPELLRAGGTGEELIHAVCSHAYGNPGVDVKPEHFMEKILFATDELTGLIWAVSIMRPSKSVMDMEVKSVKKKFKTPAFAAGCSRQVIQDGAAMLGWELDVLIEKTILAMRSCEAAVSATVETLK
jgi:predicted hydrolase (HD superfamily)